MKNTAIEASYQTVYMDPFTDYGFKKLFGEEDSKVYLIDFLNSVLTGFLPEISELTYSKNEHLGNKAIDRNAVFDLYCKSPKAKILDIQTHLIVIEELNFAFIECSKFNKTLTKDSSKQDKWLYVLSHLANLSDMPSDLSEPLFEDFFQKANVLKLAVKERALYNASLSYARDLHNIEAQNYAKGKAEGISEGKKAAAIQIARTLKKQGVEMPIIMTATNLTADDINNI
jgi:hypothetical protein